LFICKYLLFLFINQILLISQFRKKENNNKTMPEQKEALDSYLKNWMAYNDKHGSPHDQIDDILIIGIRI